MKRCPDCEFVYEDEQYTCDMDGAELVLDLSFGAPRVAVQAGLQKNNEIGASLVVVDSVTKRRPNWIWRAGVALLVCVMSGAASFLLFDIANQAEQPEIVQTTTPSLINPQLGSSTNTEAVMAASLVDGVDKSSNRSKDKELHIDPQDQLSSKKMTMTDADKSKRGTSQLNHRTRRDKRAESEPNSKIIGPTTAVKTERMSENGVAITTRADGPRQTVLRPSSRSQTDKKESRFGSFIRTTGRVIKKPFKF